jgi:hypothetical protein
VWLGLFQKKDNLSNTFFQWLPLEFLIPERESALSGKQREKQLGASEV